MFTDVKVVVFGKKRIEDNLSPQAFYSFPGRSFVFFGHGCFRGSPGPERLSSPSLAAAGLEGAVGGGFTAVRN